MKRKLLKRIGFISTVFLPITTVISCGTTKKPTKDEIDIYSWLTNDYAIKSLESEWQYETIDNQLNPQKHAWKNNMTMNKFQESMILDSHNKLDLTKPYVKTSIWYIKEKLQNDSNFIKNIGEAFASARKTSKDKNGKPEIENKFSSEWLSENGLLNEYSYGKIDPIGKPLDTTKTTISDEGLKFLILEPISGFASEMNKFIIAQNYLLNISKQDWQATFPDNYTDLSHSYKNNIKDDQFLIVKKAMEKRYFAKWHIELDKTDSQGFLDMTETPYDDALKAATDSLNTPGSLLKYSERKTRYNNGYTYLLDTTDIKANSISTKIKYNDLLNYKGVVSIDGKGTKNLSFKDLSLKEDFKIRNNWEGFIIPSKEELINDVGSKLDLTTEHTKDNKDIKISFDYVKGFMPIYDGNKFQFQDDDFKDEVAKLIAFNDPDIYKEAMNYYTTSVAKGDHNKKRDAIYIKILNKDYKKIYDEKGIVFTKEHTPKDNASK